VVNYDITPSIFDAFNSTLHSSDPAEDKSQFALGATLMLGSSLVCLSLIAALLLSRIDGDAEKSSAGPYKSTGAAAGGSKRKKMSLADLKLFPVLYVV